MDSNKNHGFTIIELSIVITIISLFLGMMVLTTKYRMDAAKEYETKQKISIINDALEEYVRKYGSLPCPSDLSLDRTNANYGISSNIASYNSAFCGSESFGLGSFSTPLTIDLNTNGMYYFLRGGVPFRTLGLDAQVSVDAWGNRIEYFMVDAFSRSENFLDNNLSYSDQYSFSILSTPYVTRQTLDSLDPAYALLSRGANEYGAYKDKNAVLINYPSPVTGNQHFGHIEENNILGPYIFIMPQNLTNNMLYFDDLIYYRSRNQLPQYLNR